MISGLFNSAPDTTLLVAGIPPSFDSGLNTNLQSFNASVQALISTRQNSGQHIQYVDISNLDPNTDKADSLHPNPAGYKIMGDNFAAAIEDVLNKGWVTAPVKISQSTGSGAPGIAKRPVGQVPGPGTMTNIGEVASGFGADPKTSFVQFADINGDGKTDYLSIDAGGKQRFTSMAARSLTAPGTGYNWEFRWLPALASPALTSGLPTSMVTAVQTT